MNIEEYISTGVLELYVLGELSPREAAEVERMAATYPRVKEELMIIEESMESFAKSLSKTPPSSVKQKIFDQIEKESVKFEPNPKVEETKVIPLNRERTSQGINFFPYMVAASVALAILFAFTTFYYRSKWKNSQGALIALQQNNVEIASNFNKVKNDLETDLQNKEQELQNHKNFLEAIRDPDSKRITLAGLPLSPESKAVVFWNTRTNIVYIDPLKLPAPASDKQYQLWALDKAGKPVDAGLLVSTETGALQQMKNIAEASAFAITLEKKGGSPAPHLEALYVLGNI